jgi:hypothetical protein
VRSKDRKSVSGYVFFIGHTTLSWASRKQKTVVLNSTLAEHNALLEAVKEALYLRQVCNFILVGTHPPPTTIHQDNLSCVAFAEKGQLSSLTKHVEVRDLWVKQEVDAGKVVLVPVRTEHMLADVLTKLMDASQLCYFNSFLAKSVSPKPPEPGLLPRAGKMEKGAKQKFRAWKKKYFASRYLPADQRVGMLMTGVFL